MKSIVAAKCPMYHYVHLFGEAVNDGKRNTEGEDMTDSDQPQRFCRNCGAQVRLGNTFCISCGTHLPSDSPISQQSNSDQNTTGWLGKLSIDSKAMLSAAAIPLAAVILPLVALISLAVFNSANSADLTGGSDDQYPSETSTQIEEVDPNDPSSLDMPNFKAESIQVQEEYGYSGEQLFITGSTGFISDEDLVTIADNIVEKTQSYDLVRTSVFLNPSEFANSSEEAADSFMYSSCTRASITMSNTPAGETISGVEAGYYEYGCF